MPSITAPTSRFLRVEPHWYGLQAKNGLQAVLMRSRAIVDAVLTFACMVRARIVQVHGAGACGCMRVGACVGVQVRTGARRCVRACMGVRRHAGVCMRRRVQACMGACMGACMRAGACVHGCAGACMCMRVRVRVRGCAGVCARAGVRAHVCACMYI